MKPKVLVFYLCLAIVFAGCAAMQPVSQPTTAVTPEPAVEEPKGLPGSHGPFDSNHRAMRRGRIKQTQPRRVAALRRV